MSKWRNTWANAIRANQYLLRDRHRGEAQFLGLIDKSPGDGMVYYSRGEGYEGLVLLDLALEDYRTAERLFPVEHWKEVARLAADRIEQKRASVRYSPRNKLWDVFHRVYSVSNIPHRVRVDALSAIARFDSEPCLSAASLRSCLEALVLFLLNQTPMDHSEKETLEGRIGFLILHNVVSEGVGQKMHKVRYLGNKGAHPEERRGVDFSPVIGCFAEILESVDKNIKINSTIPRGANRGSRLSGVRG